MSGTKVPTMHPDYHPGDALYLSPRLDTGVHIGVNGNAYVYEAGVIVSRADFLAAVAKECGVIIIDRAELPEVTELGANEHRAGHLIASGVESGDEARQAAREWFALAEYLDAHPPVDPAQVEALAADIAEYVKPGAVPGDGARRDTNSTDLARALIAAGWSK